MKQIQLKIEWKILILHLPALCLIVLGSKCLAVLTDIELVELLTKYDFEAISDHLITAKDLNFGKRLPVFFIWNTIFEIIALTLSLLISIKICTKLGVSLINAAIVFSIGLMAKLLGFFDWPLMRDIRLFFDLIPVDYGIAGVAILKGIIFILLAMAIFLGSLRIIKHNQ